MAAHPARWKLAVSDRSLKLAGNADAVLFAAELLFDGLQVSVGRNPVAGKLALTDGEVTDKYKAACKTHKLSLSSLFLDVLYDGGFKSASDDAGIAFVMQAIPLAATLGAKVIWLPLVGEHKLESAAEIDYAGDALKELGAAAEKAHVTLGLSTTLPAKETLRVVDRARSARVRVAYDVGLATQNGHKPSEELRLLGNRICAATLGDATTYLGQGAVDVPAAVAALAAAEFAGFVEIATATPSGDPEIDATKNQTYVRELMRAGR